MTRTLYSKLLLLFCCMALVLCIPVVTRADTDQDAGARIVACYESGDESVDLAEFGLTVDELSKLYYELLQSGKLPWYADNYRYTYDTENLVLKFYPENLDETVYIRERYEQRVAEILKETVLPGMSQWQIALAIHDYLAVHGAYDESYTYYTAYDLLVNGTAVCQGYSLAYMDLMNRAGVPCVEVRSEEMNHAWNLVQIDGSWYHVDVTWDDPISDHHGRCDHKFFLISDQLMQDPAYEHPSWETDIACTDTRFDDEVFWQGITSPVCYVSDVTSYIREYDDDGAYDIYRRNEETAELTRIGGTELSYIDIGEGRLGYFGDGLSVWNDRLYYADMEKVYSCTLAGGEERVEFAVDGDAWQRVIVGCAVDEGMISLTLLGDQENLTHIQIPTTDDTGHIHHYTETLTEATCREQGYTTYTCSCGTEYRGDFTPVLEHDFDKGKITKAATPEYPGELIRTCSRCGEEQVEKIPRLPEEEPPLKVFWESSGVLERFLILCTAGAALLGVISLFRKKR